MTFIALGLASIFVLATVLPFIPTEHRWVRVLDFPRLQILAGLVASLFLVFFFADLSTLQRAGTMTVVISAILYQLFQIGRYTPLYPVQAATAVSTDRQACMTLLVANVLMENRNAEGLLELVENHQPDVVLFVETDDWWDQKLKCLQTTYSHAIRRPQDNHYGMILYSRLETIDPEVRFLVRDEIPSFRSQIRLESGDRILLYGLHPVPPPLADTDMRDAEILLVAGEVRDLEMPVIVAGDLNDVSWSRTTRLFMRISRLLDPRIGRGLFASYNARNPLLRWPLDHIFLDRRFGIGDIRLLDSFGSDHFPIYAEICYQPESPAPGAPSAASRDDVEDTAEKIRQGRNADPDNSEYPKPPEDTETVKT